MTHLTSLDDLGSVAAVLAWVGWITLGNPRQRLTPADRVRDAGTRRWAWTVVLTSLGLALGAAVAIPIAAMAGPAWAPRLAGAAMAGIGIAVRESAIRALGASFTDRITVREGQPLVTTGPYRFVRHPGYAGSILTLAGLGLTLDNWASLAILLVGSTLAHVPRIRVEERVLEAELGDAYRDFERTRRRLIPGIW